VLDLDRIFEKTDGRCHLCWRTLAWSNYGQPGARGAWEIEHSRPQANGGSNHGSNLYPSCIPCNRAKAHRWSSRSVRRRNGCRRTPLSRTHQSAARNLQAVSGAFLGCLIGRELGSVPIAIKLGAIGAAVGYVLDPESGFLE
jgi:hypothetical protein